LIMEGATSFKILAHFFQRHKAVYQFYDISTSEELVYKTLWNPVGHSLV
ncbi:MAG: hypothetical protein ACI909_003489, partial [Planctomycetota bacterium]